MVGKAGFSRRFVKLSYRKVVSALGIHGQWLYINPRTEMVIVKLSSQPRPLDDRLDMANLEVMGELCLYFHH